MVTWPDPDYILQQHFIGDAGTCFPISCAKPLSVGKFTYLKFLDDGRVLHLDFKGIWGDDSFLQKNKVRVEFMKRHITASTLTHGKLTLTLFLHNTNICLCTLFDQLAEKQKQHHKHIFPRLKTAHCLLCWYCDAAVFSRPEQIPACSLVEDLLCTSRKQICSTWVSKGTNLLTSDSSLSSFWFFNFREHGGRLRNGS